MAAYVLAGYPADAEWQAMLGYLLDHGHPICSHGRPAVEIEGFQTAVDMRHPILTIKERKLGYRFMPAEAYWILSGDHLVSGIAPYSKTVSQFSDDGITFFGAYGPKITSQLLYVRDTLIKDLQSRQAVINIWRESPPESKDIPCTLSLQFLVRPHNTTYFVDCIATMRSSDAWLGWPYDVFNFSMVSATVILMLKQWYPRLDLGTLVLTAGSQHLYKQNIEGAMQCRESRNYRIFKSIDIHSFDTPVHLLHHLRDIRDMRFDTLNNDFMGEFKLWREQKELA